MYATALIGAMLAAVFAIGPAGGAYLTIALAAAKLAVLGLVGCADIAPYNASKGGVRLYSKSWRCPAPSRA